MCKVISETIHWILFLGGKAPSFWRRTENRILRAKGKDKIMRRGK
jgi:hypothetical protein